MFSVTKSLGPVPLFFSIKFKFYWIVLTLFACVLAIMIITIISLRGEGDSWMEETGLDLEAQQLSNLHSISESKAVFVQVLTSCYFFDIIILMIIAFSCRHLWCK